MTHFHFIRPQWLWMLLPTMLLLYGFWRNYRLQNEWHSVCDAHLLPHLLGDKNNTSKKWIVSLIGFAWCISIVALAGPAWKQAPSAVYKQNKATVIVFNVSQSLYARDLKPNRLVRARYKIQDLLKRSGSGQVALIAYAGEPYTVSPLTQDAETIMALVPELDPNIMPLVGANMAAALEKAENLLTQVGVKHANIILVTDGGIDPKAIAKTTQLASEGFRVSVFGIGSSKGVPIPTADGFMRDGDDNILIAKLPVEKMEQLATAGQGLYQRFTRDDSDINALSRVGLQNQSIEAHKLQQKSNRWVDEGHWLVLLLLLFAALGFRRGWLEVLV